VAKQLAWVDELDDIPERGMEPASTVKPCPYCGFISPVWGWHVEYESKEPFGTGLQYSLAMGTLEHIVQPEHYQDAIELYAARYGIQGRRYWIRMGDLAVELQTTRGWSITTNEEVVASWRSDLKERGWLTELATSEELTGATGLEASGRRVGHGIPRRIRKRG
jgi:hypothetical protein